MAESVDAFGCHHADWYAMLPPPFPQVWDTTDLVLAVLITIGPVFFSAAIYVLLYQM